MSDFCETVSECALVLSVLDLDYDLEDTKTMA